MKSVLSFLAGLALCVPTALPAADAPPMFRTVSTATPGAAAPGKPRSGPRLALRQDAAPARWGPGQRWAIPLPDDGNAVFTIESVKFSGPGAVAARGRIEGVPGSEVLMASRDGAVAAVFRMGNDSPARLVPVSPGESEMQPVSSGLPPQCGNELRPLPPIAGSWVAGSNPRAPSAALAEASTENAVVDVAFFYTAAAEEGAGGPAGIRALLDLAVIEANDAYSRSGGRVTLRATCVAPAEYTESGDIYTDLGKLGDPRDPAFAKARELAEKHAADAVCLIVEHESSGLALAGLANQLRSRLPSAVAAAFTVCLRPYLVGNYTLPHEIGHLLGCNHDRDHAPGGGLDPWSYGTRIMVDGVEYRTVMAYRPGFQFPHFSNPEIQFRGVPTGVAGGSRQADNIRTLNSTAALLAAVREPAGRVGFNSDAMTVVESDGVVRVPWKHSGQIAGARFSARSFPGTAQPDVDYDPIDLTIDASPEMPELEIRIRDNALVDGPRTFAIRLDDPSAGLAVGPVAVLTVTILDDEEEAAAPLDTSVDARPGADYAVSALAITSDDRVVAGGGFVTFNGTERRRLARLHLNGAVDDAFKPAVKYHVRSVVPLPEGRVAIGGEFNTINNVTRQHVAILRADGSVDPAFAFESGTDQPVQAVAPGPDGSLYVGGRFLNVQGAPARRVARLLPNGQRDSEFATGVGPDGEVFALLPDEPPGRGVVIGGRFERVGNVPRRGLARLDARGALDPQFAASLGLNGPARALLRDGAGRIILAGEFTLAEGEPAARVARLTAEGRLDSQFNTRNAANGPVFALAPGPNDTLWIAGAFTRVQDQPRARVARLLPDGSLDPAFDPGVGPDDWVLALAPRPDGGIFIGGLFTRVNGAPRGGFAGLLDVPIAPARFTGARSGDGALEWSAAGLPRQTYAVQVSTNFVDWTTADVVTTGGDGTAAGAWPASPADPAADRAFIRLRRLLE